MIIKAYLMQSTSMLEHVNVMIRSDQLLIITCEIYWISESAMLFSNKKFPL